VEQGNLGEWGQFLENIRTLFQHKLDTQPHTLPREQAIDLLDDVLRSLRTEELEGLIRDVEDREFESLLLRELQLFNQAVSVDLEERRYEGQPGAERLNLRLDQAQTIKESVQEHIERLPERVKKLLSILDELLSLVKG